MNRIRVLPEILANKIAAGEIVERPASVVKELLENSLDAKSRSIRIRVTGGGKRSIIVRDDGEGMSQDDALLAFEHHATSKLRTDEDLGAIATLGFRGEALPSIASVSRLTLRTKEGSAESISGTEIEIHGGIIRSVKSIAWDRGTEMEIRGLFHNLPARKKFLRSNETELGHVARLATHYCLARPEIRFSLESEGRTLLDTVPASGLRERIYQVFGEAFLENLLEFSGEAGPLKVYGYGSKPGEQRTNAYSQYIYVNRRMVRDKVILSAIRQAYRKYLSSAAYPVVVLFVELPFEDVDVNAHPAKTEIRFHDQNRVHQMILETLERALSENMTIASYTHRPPLPEAAEIAESRSPEVASAPTPDRIGGSRSFDFLSREAAPAPDTPTQVPSASAEFSALAVALERLPRDRFADEESALSRHLSMKLAPEMLYNAAREATSVFQPEGVKILGQLHNSYIVACDAEGLLLIDQHVAHERILYEKLAGAMEKGGVETQGLLTPVSLDLVPAQKARMERILSELEINGFQVEPFGGCSILIRSVPAICVPGDSQRLLVEIVESLEQEERTLDVGRIRDKIAVASACRAAVKIHMPLGMEKMRWLLDQLSTTRRPTHCPHGRPILLRFSIREIERNFGRG